MSRLKIFIQCFSKFAVPVLLVFFVNQSFTMKAFADEEKKATIALSFDQNDSTRFCKATVTCENKPVKEIDLHFYVKRMYNPLPIGKAIETDSAGEAIATFPLDLPGDKSGNIIAIAKIEDDDTYGNVETQAEVKWGVLPSTDEDSWSNRSLSASRNKAPMVLILVSNLIILVIWGTIFYVIYQVFRIRKESQMLKSKN